MKKIFGKYAIQISMVISGLLTALTVAFPSIGLLEWVSLMPMAYALFKVCGNREISFRKIYGYGVIFFLSYYLVIYHWLLYMYPMSFMEMEEAVALTVVIIAWIGLSVLQTLTSSLIFLVFAFVYRSSAFKKVKILAPFFLACLWAIIEWTQTIGWWGVPWGRLCLGQTENTLQLLSASILGSYFVSFLIVAVNACGAYFCAHEEKKKVLIACIAIMFVGNTLLGVAVRVTYNNDGNDKKIFSVVQANIPLQEKWTSTMNESIEKLHTKYTVQAAEEGADVVVFAETAFPHDMDRELREYFSSLAMDTNTTIIASCFIQPDEPVYAESGRERSYNSIFEVKKDGTISEEFYSKQRRVPFAEFVPFRAVVSFLIPPLADLNMMPDDILPGESSVVLHTEEGNIGGAICFDSVYENITLEAVRDGAEVIIVSTNDAWFDDSRENYMHTSQSKLRAIETGRYVVRAANTGISGVIDPLGNFTERLGVLEEGVVTSEVYLRNSTTVYTVIGNAFAYMCLALSCAALGISMVVAIKDKRAAKKI